MSMELGPYTNFHELNLDWFLNEFNKVVAEWAEMRKSFSSLNDAFNDLRSYVNDYFKNLDVQEEIDKKLDAMAKDGSLYAIIRKYTDPIVNEQDAKITVLETRMNTFASLPEGSTTGDAELIDIRVPASGFNGNKTYPSAGDAVRGQVSLVRKDINNVADEFSETIIRDYSGNLFNKKAFIKDKEIDAFGKIIDNNQSYGISEYIPVKRGTVYFKNKGVLSNATYSMVYNKDKTAALPLRLHNVNHIDIDIDFGYIIINIGTWEIENFSVEYNDINNGYIPYTSRKNMVKTNIVECDELRYKTLKSGIMASVNMFGSAGAIGDSYTAGYSAYSNNSGGKDMIEQSYIATICKRAGIEWANYGVTGAYTASYNASDINMVLNDTPKDLYILALGQNDINQNFPKGSVSDIDVNNWLNSSPNTFCGCYGKIITRVMHHAPKAKFIIVKSWINWNTSGGISYQSYDDAIENIANLYGFPYISPFEDEFFNSDIYKNNIVQGHPTTMTYSMMGLAMERLISKCIMENPNYFKFSTIG